MIYELIPSESFLKRLKKLDKSVVLELEKKLLSIKENPVNEERRMRNGYNYFRVYVRNFRLIYKVEQKKIILFGLRKRNEGYDDLG